MKYLAFLIILSFNLSFAQLSKDSNLSGSASVKESDLLTNLNYYNQDFNEDQQMETLRGEKVVRLSNNEYWIVNGELVTSNGNNFRFNNKLTKNNNVLLQQVNAENGYILSFTPHESEAEVYIADGHGNKASDPLTILLK